MGLFSKEKCEFCQAEVGALSRTKLRTKEFICNDCREKTNEFARMDYCSKKDIQDMMERIPREAEEFDEATDAKWHSYKLGNDRIQYRVDLDRGLFQIKTKGSSRYPGPPVWSFLWMIPYRHISANENVLHTRYREIEDLDAEYVEVRESKNSRDEVDEACLVIPYNDPCIREIKIEARLRDPEMLETFYDMAHRINLDRKRWFKENSKKEDLHLRNIGKTLGAAVREGIKGGDVKESLAEGIDRAHEIDEGKIKKGLFGGFKKKKK